MSYPNFQGKHLEQALFNPEDFVNWRNYLKKNYKNAPKKYIIIYYPKILNNFKRKYKTKKIKLYRLITIYQYKAVGVICMTGIGSAHATVVFEELIALGGKEFFNIGSAGGLKDFGVFLCDKAIRDEGTSYHYIAHEKFAYPDKELTERFEKILLKNNILFQKAASWTIDAPYRETKAEIQRYKKEGISTVEMEASALFTVAKIRKVKIASAFVVSDLLDNDKWNPQFDAKHVNKKINKLFDLALECLLKN
ncbi:nucleoside phosphorylase [Candidatus Woesearchaeota archaeon]|nr:nucleoside phosphorylase [Candidatus Woesearchaeota archaeon]